MPVRSQSQIAREHWASLTPEERSAIGQKAAESRRRNARAQRLSEIAHKAVRTRRRNAKARVKAATAAATRSREYWASLTPEKRSAIGQKAAETRRRNLGL